MREIDKARLTILASSGKKMVVMHRTMDEAKEEFIEYVKWLRDAELPSGVDVVMANGICVVDIKLGGSIWFDAGPAHLDGAEVYEPLPDPLG